MEFSRAGVLAVAALAVCFYYSAQTLFILVVGIYLSTFSWSSPVRDLRTGHTVFPSRERVDPSRNEPAISVNEELGKALEAVIAQIGAKYIKSWHKWPTFGDSFPEQVDVALHDIFRNLHDLNTAIRWPEFMVGSILPKITAHIECFLEAENVLKSDKDLLPRLSESDYLHDKTSALYERILQEHGEVLHSGVYNYRSWVQTRITRVLSLLLQGTSGQELGQWQLTSNLIRDIVGNSVMAPLLGLLSNPDFWNQQIVKVSEAALRDRVKVNKIRKAIESSLATGSLPTMGLDTDSEGFVKFLDGVSAIKSLALARQTLYSVNLQLQRLQSGQVTLLSEDYVPYSDLRVFKERLNVSKSALEAKIRELAPYSFAEDKSGRFEAFTLDDILNLPQASDYFDEFLENRNINLSKAYRKIIQLDSGAVDPLGGLQIMQEPGLKVQKQDHDSVVGLYHDYLLHMPAGVEIPQREVFEKFVVNTNPDYGDYIEIQRLLWETKDLIFRTLDEKYLGSFKKSSFFVKFVESSSNNRLSTIDRLQTDDVLFDSELRFSRSEIVLDTVQEAVASLKFTSEELDEEDSESIEEENQVTRDYFQSMLPGTYQRDYKEQIASLDNEVQELTNQLSVIGRLLRKAELTNDESQLSILRQASTSLDREIHRRNVMKEQLLIKSTESSFYGRTAITISSHVQGSDSTGEFTLYLVQVQRIGGTDGWVVPRRYRQFYALHRILREQFPEIREFQFPKKKVVLKFQQRQFVETRMQAFSAYLDALLKLQPAAEHLAFRMFLTSEDFPNTYYESVEIRSNSVVSETLTETKDSELEGQQFLESKGFTQPLSSAFLTVFGIDERSDWLRGKALVLVLQQILGGAIEKRIRDLIDGLPLQLPGWIDNARSSIWPKIPQSKYERSLAERIESRNLAKQLLQRLIKSWMSRIIGVSKSEYASETVFNVLQNSTLNRHLFLTILDIYFAELEEAAIRLRDGITEPPLSASMMASAVMTPDLA